MGKFGSVITTGRVFWEPVYRYLFFPYLGVNSNADWNIERWKYSRIPRDDSRNGHCKIARARDAGAFPGDSLLIMLLAGYRGWVIDFFAINIFALKIRYIDWWTTKNRRDHFDLGVPSLRSQRSYFDFPNSFDHYREYFHADGACFTTMRENNRRRIDARVNLAVGAHNACIQYMYPYVSTVANFHTIKYRTPPSAMRPTSSCALAINPGSIY